MLNGGPSRFYELFLTDPLSPGTVIPFWVVGNDGNLLPKPKQVTSFRISVAERYDIIIDFNQVKNLIGSHTKVRLENRMIQDDGQGPTCDVSYPGQGTYCVEFRIGAAVTDNSVDPATQPSFYTLPTVIAPRVTRHFEFDRLAASAVTFSFTLSVSVLRKTRLATSRLLPGSMEQVRDGRF